MPVNSRNGWGFKTALLGVSKTVAGVNVVTQDVGLAVVVQAAGDIRLAKIMYRADLAPDVPPFTVSVPVRFRVVVLNAGQAPQNVAAWQRQDFATALAAHPEIASGSPIEVLHDIWLDFSAGDPGLNRLAEVEFTDAGPRVPGNGTMVILFVPVADGQMDQSIIPANGTIANAQLTLAAFGLGDDTSQQGAVSTQRTSRSIPRFDVSIGGQ